MIVDYLVVHHGWQLTSRPAKDLLPKGLMDQTKMWFFGNIQTPWTKMAYDFSTASVDLEVA